MPESDGVRVTLRDVAIEPRTADLILLTRVEQKLDVLAQAIGGPTLKGRWDAIEAKFGVSVRRRTFKRRRCGCFAGVAHDDGCAKAS